MEHVDPFVAALTSGISNEINRSVAYGTQPRKIGYSKKKRSRRRAAKLSRKINRRK